MKTKLFRIAAILAVASVLFFITTGAVPGKQTGAASSVVVQQQTATLHISEELFNMLKQGTLVQARLTAPHEYTALRTIQQPQHVSAVNDPCEKDWDDFNRFWKENIDAMQAWANENCASYFGCWSGQCYNIMFVVNPSIPCNGPSEYKGTIRVFEN